MKRTLLKRPKMHLHFSRGLTPFACLLCCFFWQKKRKQRSIQKKTVLKKIKSVTLFAGGLHENFQTLPYLTINITPSILRGFIQHSKHVIIYALYVMPSPLLKITLESKNYSIGGMNTPTTYLLSFW